MNIAYRCLLTYLFFVIGLEGTVYAIFLFSHFVNDINAKNAQKDFSIGFGLFWISSFVFDPIVGLFVDKTGWRISTLVALMVVKIIALVCYSFSQHEYVALVSLMVAGLSKELKPILFAEVKHLVEEKKRVGLLSMFYFACLTGNFTACLLRLLPRDFTFILFTKRISTSTLPTLVVALLFFIAIIATLCVPRCKSTPIIHDQANAKECEETTGKNTVTIAIILFCPLLVRLTWQISTMTLQEYGEIYKISSWNLSLLFGLRYSLAMIGNRLSPVLLRHFDEVNVIAVWQLSRMGSMLLLFFSSVNGNVFVKKLFLHLVVAIHSISWYNDESVLLPKLWMTSKRVTLLSAIYLLFGKTGYLLTLVYPISFNFIELIYALVFFCTVLYFAGCAAVGVI